MRARLRAIGQEQVLAYWDELSEQQRDLLLQDFSRIPLEAVPELVERHVLADGAAQTPQRVEPPPSFPAEPGPGQRELYRRARQRGEAAIASGKVAAFTVAGGQGTRLDFDGPKGAYRISPVRGAPLFQLFAEALLGVRRRFGVLPPWYIMTSPANHAETVDFFAEHGYFGLPAEQVVFFSQGQLPVFRPDGQMALAERHRLALAPDGHGGSLDAMQRSGALQQMERRGIELISYFQVDNPLVQVVDPLFIGLHLETGSEMSSKAVPKALDLEPVGNFCLADGKVSVIEYSDLPEELAHRKNPDGSRCFDAGSIAIHVLDRAFVQRITEEGAVRRLPWHRANKKATVLDEAGVPVQPEAPNAVKLERFVFDAIPLAQNPLVLFTRRAEEFSPVKNAEGSDSPATSRRDMIRRAARWLERAGITLPRDAEGEPALPVEITPTFALDPDDLKEQLARGSEALGQKGLLLG